MASDPMTIGSLFSGIGGLELGLEWAGLGPVLWQVEQSEFCRDILAKHWPEVERHEDVRAVGAATLAPVDLICGGFPCQDVSSAGARKGLAGERSGLWFEFARIVGELRPAWVVVENVASGAALWVDAVVRELGELGYEALPIPLSAADVGAPHLRRRIFVVAHTDLSGQHARSIDAEVAGASATADATGTRLLRTVCGVENGRTESTSSPWAKDTMPQPALSRVADGPGAWLDRTARLRALGNAVVPQCAEVIGWVVRELSGPAEISDGV